MVTWSSARRLARPLSRETQVRRNVDAVGAQRRSDARLRQYGGVSRDGCGGHQPQPSGEDQLRPTDSPVRCCPRPRLEQLPPARHLAVRRILDLPVRWPFRPSYSGCAAPSRRAFQITLAGRLEERPSARLDVLHVGDGGGARGHQPRQRRLLLNEWRKSRAAETGRPRRNSSRLNCERPWSSSRADGLAVEDRVPRARGRRDDAAQGAERPVGVAAT
jgi:hypothetical protein